MIVLPFRVDPAAPTTSYANSGGTGARTGIITATGTASAIDTGVTPSKSVDGSFTTGVGAGSCGCGGTVTAGQYMRWRFASSAYIDEVKIYYDRVPANGSWKIQGSFDATTWDDLATFTWDAQTKTVTLTNGVAEGYLYYQMICPAGNAITAGWFEEIEFKIAPGAT
jgi:hypothetical protein